MIRGARRFPPGTPSALLALAVLVLTPSSQARASTSPSWESQPAWASGSDNDSDSDASQQAVSVSRRKKERYSRSVYAPTPFSPGSNNVAIDVGQVFLMGSLNSQYADSIGSQLHYTYGVSDLFGFDSSLGYSSHSNGMFSMTTLLTGLRMNLSWYDRVVPYFVFGLGFYRPSYDLTQYGGTGSASPVLFGVHMGPGVDLEITRQLFFGASLTLHDAFGQTTMTPDGVLGMGGTFMSFLVHAGFTF